MDFIESLPKMDRQHWFVFCTHANVIGNIFPSITKRLKEKGATVIGFHNTYASLTVPYYPNPSFTTGHPDKYDFEQAKSFGREIATRSPQITNPDSDLIPTPQPVSSEEWVQESDKLTLEYLTKIMPKLSIDMEKCIQCHTCEKNCPVQGIDIETDPPRIQTPCIYCWRCVNICPTIAISGNWDKMISIAPTYYSRYKKVLDEAAARGEFRWLVNPETIKFDTPLYKQRELKVKNKEE
jgi:ferredoxin